MAQYLDGGPGNTPDPRLAMGGAGRTAPPNPCGPHRVPLIQGWSHQQDCIVAPGTIYREQSTHHTFTSQWSEQRSGPATRTAWVPTHSPHPPRARVTLLGLRGRGQLEEGFVTNGRSSGPAVTLPGSPGWEAPPGAHPGGISESGTAARWGMDMFLLLKSQLFKNTLNWGAPKWLRGSTPDLSSGVDLRAPRSGPVLGSAGRGAHLKKNTPEPAQGPPLTTGPQRLPRRFASQQTRNERTHFVAEVYF